MALTSIAGFQIPTEWVYGGIALFVFLVIIIFLLVFRRGNHGRQNSSPIEQKMAMVLKVDENGTLQPGKLLADVQQTEKDLLIRDPDIIDETTDEPKLFHVPYADVIPAQVIDAMRNLLEIWGIILRKGEYQAFSFASIVTQVRQRFDPLEADPRDVGGHYVPMPWTKSGLTQLIQSTTGKVLVMGAAWLIGYLLGLVTLGLKIGHF